MRRPGSRKGREKWKHRLKAGLMAEHLEGLQKVKAKQTQDRSDSLMLASLGGGVGQATKWERVVPNMATRVKLHKLKLGVVPHTKWAKHQQLVIRGKWGRMSPGERAEFLKCPCGAGKQTITHVLKGCPVAHHTLVSGLAQVPGVTAFDKFSAVLSAEDVLHSDIQVILGNVEKLPDVL